MARIFISGMIPQPSVDLLTAEGHEVTQWDQPTAIGREELLSRIRGSDAIITLLTEQVNEEFLRSAGVQLRVISNVAVGYNNIDVRACAERGVTVTNTPGVLTEATADIALSLILMATRRLAEGERLVRSREPWQWGMFHLLGSGIQGKRLGIIGMGAIGAATARRARAFGMTITYCNRSAVALELEEELGALRLSFDELLRTSDVVSIHCPYSTATHHLINTEALALMKPEAFLVNTARGPIVDEAALVRALSEGSIAGAGLDVYEHEPVIHPGLLDRDDVVLLPHLGSATLDTRTAMSSLAASNVLAILRGEPPLTPVHPAS